MLFLLNQKIFYYLNGLMILNVQIFYAKNDLPRALARGNKAPQPFSILGFSSQTLQGVKTPDRPEML
jgi:hypothetical protein